MARAGLGKHWHCTFANDFDPMKADVYEANWGDRPLVQDVNRIIAADLPGCADLVWASFPCQDLSLAGNNAGIGTENEQTRSGAFWAFWRLIEAMRADNRAPPVVVLENVYGSLTANGGRDFAAIARSLALGGYRCGAMLIDAAAFLPQSRPRIFITAVRNDLFVPRHLLASGPTEHWHPPAMERAVNRLAEDDRSQWLWFNPAPTRQDIPLLEALIDDAPSGVEWHTSAETARLLGMMSGLNQQKLASLQRDGRRRVATIYKRTRPGPDGIRRQRAELRDDGIAGCLRTPGGGSSRQVIVLVKGQTIRSRLLAPREAARLMGLPETYNLPPRYNDAYHVAGDGLAVPVVRFLAASVIEPILAANTVPAHAIAAE